MATRERTEPGLVTWVDLQTPDLHGARRFYGELFGWSFEGGDDPATGYYTVARARGRMVAGMASMGGEAPPPPTWSVYIAVESADDAAKRVAAAGGQVLAGPMDVPGGAGRLAYFADPTGATFGVWQAGLHSGAELVEEPGAMTWHEVYTRDLSRARDFYARVFGLEPRRMDAPGIDYWTLHKGEAVIGGAMQMTRQFPPEVPSHWNTYFAVADADEAIRKVSALGGKVLQPPFDTPYGRMALVADPWGAQFCVIKRAEGA